MSQPRVDMTSAISWTAASLSVLSIIIRRSGLRKFVMFPDWSCGVSLYFSVSGCNRGILRGLFLLNRHLCFRLDCVNRGGAVNNWNIFLSVYDLEQHVNEVLRL